MQLWVLFCIYLLILTFGWVTVTGLRHIEDDLDLIQQQTAHTTQVPTG